MKRVRVKVERGVVQYKGVTTDKDNNMADSDDNDDKIERYLTPIEREALRVTQARIRGSLRVRIAHYAAQACRIIEECRAFKESLQPGEEELLATVEEDEKICDSFLDMVMRNAEFEEDNLLATHLVEVGIQVLIDRFGNTVLPDLTRQD